MDSFKEFMKAAGNYTTQRLNDAVEQRQAAHQLLFLQNDYMAFGRDLYDIFTNTHIECLDGYEDATDFFIIDGVLPEGGYAYQLYPKRILDKTDKKIIIKRLSSKMAKKCGMPFEIFKQFYDIKISDDRFIVKRIK